jgi:hypothetical protein
MSTAIQLLPNQAFSRQFPTAIARPSIGDGRLNKQFAPTMSSGPARVVPRSNGTDAGARTGVTVNPNATVIQSGNLLFQTRPGSREVTAIGFTAQTNTAAIMDNIVFRKDLASASDSAEVIPGYSMGEYRSYQKLARELEKAEPNSGYARQTARELVVELVDFEKAWVEALNSGPRASFDIDHGRFVVPTAEELAYREQRAQEREKERARYSCLMKQVTVTAPKSNGRVFTSAAVSVAGFRDGQRLLNGVTNFAQIQISIGNRTQTVKESASSIATASAAITGYREATVVPNGQCVIRGIGELPAVLIP